MPRTPPIAEVGLHWTPQGLFPVCVVGASFHESVIADLAQNPPGKEALVFCTALLQPVGRNPHDANAVEVWIEGRPVGFLPRDFASDYRNFFKKFGLPLLDTTCDAAISNGLLFEGKQYAYSIELDIPLNPDTPPAHLAPTYPELYRAHPEPQFLRQADGSYLVTVRLRPDALENMHRRREVFTWTADSWTTVNYYLNNRQSIGLGFKLFEIEKGLNERMFGKEEPAAQVVAIEGRMATIQLRPKAPLLG